MAELHPERFAADVLDQPRVFARPATAALAEPLARRARRVLFLGMGSSRFAALDAASRLRAHGVDASAEIASTGLPQPPAPDTLVLAVSATGGSAETVAAMRRHVGTSMVVGLTSRPQSPIGQEADVCLEIAPDGPSGVACASYRSTVAMLQRVCGMVAGGAAPGPESPRLAAEVSARVLDRRDEWLPKAADLLAGGPVHVLAPAERIGSAEQSALMLREVPRVAAYACETGDWSHVDVYLTKRPGYRVLLLRGSRHEAEVMEWAAARGFPVVVAGGSLAGSALDIDLPGTDDPFVRQLIETLVAELLAAELWARDPI
jgi:glucosamine--fructose-6-phosphate aminotransferase (isomerizing)